MPDDLLGAGLPGQQRVLAEGVEAPAPAGVTVHVDERLEHHVHAQVLGVPADHDAVGPRVGPAERRGDAHRRGHAGRVLPGDDAGRAVGKLQRRDAQPRDAGQVPRLVLLGRARRLGLALDQGELLVQCHLAEQVVHAPVTGHPGHRARRGEGAGGAADADGHRGAHGGDAHDGESPRSRSSHPTAPSGEFVPAQGEASCAQPRSAAETVDLPDTDDGTAVATRTLQMRPQPVKMLPSRAFSSEQRENPRPRRRDGHPPGAAEPDGPVLDRGSDRLRSRRPCPRHRPLTRRRRGGRPRPARARRSAATSTATSPSTSAAASTAGSGSARTRRSRTRAASASTSSRRCARCTSPTCAGRAAASPTSTTGATASARATSAPGWSTPTGATSSRTTPSARTSSWRCASCSAPSPTSRATSAPARCGR